ncbi:MAG TPA: HTH domain-containing protein [Methanosarcinales archaeon]|nr:HTH domain-containing protein [Methanosarcinales archaeon]
MIYKMTDNKWNSIKWFFDRLWENPDSFPDRGVLLALSEKDRKELFTSSRVALLRILLKHKSSISLSKLAELLQCSSDAIMQDIEVLEHLFLIKKDEKGYWKDNEAILLPEIELIIKRLEDSMLTTA